MTKPITVMIVDDHEMVRQGAVGYLQAQPDLKVVAEAESGVEAIQLVREYVPDVVLMDLVMPGMDGVEATRKIKDISPRTQVIVLTSYHQDEHIFPALQAGAISYLLKDVKARELVEAIQRAAKGEATLHPRVAARVIKYADRPVKLLSEGEANRSYTVRLSAASKTAVEKIEKAGGQVILPEPAPEKRGKYKKRAERND